MGAFINAYSGKIFSLARVKESDLATLVRCISSQRNWWFRNAQLRRWHVDLTTKRRKVSSKSWRIAANLAVEFTVDDDYDKASVNLRVQSMNESWELLPDRPRYSRRTTRPFGQSLHAKMTSFSSRRRMREND